MIETNSRDRMIAAGVTLFARAGYSGVTTKEIAQIAQVSEGNIYRYFPTKRDLFLCAFESELQRLSVHAEALARIANIEDSQVALQSVLKLITETMVKQPELVRLLHFSALELGADIEPVLRRNVHPLIETLGPRLKKWACNHASCDISPTTTVLFLIATVMLLQDFFPAFSGWPLPFESVENATAMYAELWCRVLTTMPVTDLLVV